MAAFMLKASAVLALLGIALIVSHPRGTEMWGIGLVLLLGAPIWALIAAMIGA